MKLDTQLSDQPSDPLKVLVVGAGGGTGIETVGQLLQQGHTVTAFSRHASGRFASTDRLAILDGDVMIPADIEHAVEGQDVVIVVLGINENPIRVRLIGTGHTPLNVRSGGTQNVVNAMRKHGVSHLIVQSSFGVGETRKLLGVANRLFFSLVLKPQIADTERQEIVVRDSGLDWVLVQPVHLTDSGEPLSPYLSTEGKTRAMKVARSSVARFLADAVQTPELKGKTVAVSG